MVTCMKLESTAMTNDRPGGGTRAAPGDPASSAPQPAYQELLHFFNQSPDMLCIAGFDGRFKRLNPAWQQALGWTSEELQASPFLEFVHPDDRPATLVEMEKLAYGAATITFENRYRCKDGGWKWMQWTARPLPDLQETYAIARDVTRQKLLEEEILITQDRERERVGRELHDGLCQDLAGIAALSISLARKLAPESAPGSAAAREIGSLLGETIRHTRDLARGMNPLHLKTTGLAASIDEYCRRIGELFRITCRFHQSMDAPNLNPDQAVHLYRIVQQASNNAITHGRAKCIDVHLKCLDGMGCLEIHDDGVGLAEGTTSHLPGIGLHTMSYRARLIGGSLDLKRGSLHGTVVTCVFPIPQANPHP